MKSRRTHRSTVVCLTLVSAVALTGCSAAASGESSTATAAAGAVDLSGVCPSTVVVQTDWNPETEHGHLYEMFGDDAVIDPATKSVSGTLYAQGNSTGVKLEVRAGGPAIGFQTVSSQLYQDPSITLGYVGTNEAIQVSGTAPTTAVFAPLDTSPLMIMWDPATYPDVKTVKDLAAAGATIRYFGGSSYMDYFTGAGIVPAAQADGSFDGTPAAFIASGGKNGQQGYATSDPFIYGTELPAWNKPVQYQLINDAGFPYYQSAVSVRTGDIDKLSPCLTALVPVLQQAQADFMASPDAANALILKAVSEYNNGWVYTSGDAEYAYNAMLKDGFVSNGANSTIGDFDEARVQKVLDIVSPIFTSQGSQLAPDITAGSVYTNKFIDPSIGMAN